MKFFLILFLLLCLQVLSKDRETPAVYYLDENYQWAGPAKIKLRGKKIVSITKINTFTNKYLTPSFCDAQVTLSINSLGGGNDKDGMLLALKSLLAHGFTHILSSFEPDWVKKHYNELLKKMTLIPNVIFLEKPILPSTREYPDIPSDVYFTSNKKEDLIQEIQRRSNLNLPILLVHRYFPDNQVVWTSEDFYKIFSKSKDKKIAVSSFGDKISILDTLLSGGSYIQHPIPVSMEKNIQKEHLARIQWMPLFNVYQKIDIIYKEELEEYKQELERVSPFYKKYYSGKMKDFSFSNTDESKYDEYMKYYNKRPELVSKMILGSGSGNLLSFPGISGLEELKLLFNSKQEENEYLKPAIQNACQFMGVQEKREIREGREVDMILFSKNPSDPTHLFSIEKVYYQGEEIGH